MFRLLSLIITYDCPAFIVPTARQFTTETLLPGLVVMAGILSFTPARAQAPLVSFERDTHLAQIIAELDLLGTPHLQTGVAISHPSPLTEEAIWTRYPSETEIAAERLTPNEHTVLALEGEASYYHRGGCLGCVPKGIAADGQPIFTTATGELLRDDALTLAIGAHLKHLVGYRARVTNLATGQSVEARINDTGGFYRAKYGHRVADLTIATKRAIGLRGSTGQVRVEILL